MDEKDFRQAMKWYRRAPVTHVAPETGSLAVPLKKDVTHREKARVWFPRQTPACSERQQEGGDAGQPEEKPEEIMQGAVTVYQEKKVAAYGRMEKVDEPEAMDAPDMPLAEAMSADNPPCDVDFRAVPDGEVLQLGMAEEPVSSGEGTVSDSPFEDMIASVEAGLASMLAEGPPVADAGHDDEEQVDDKVAALLAGMSEEERAEIAGFDLSLLREDEPAQADSLAAPEPALTAGMSEEELAEIAGFDPALLADGSEAAMQAEPEKEPESVVVEEAVQADEANPVEAGMEEVSAAEEPVAEAAALASGSGEAQAEEAARDEADVADEPVVPEAEDGSAVAVNENTGETEEALLAGESEPGALEQKAAEEVEPEFSAESAAADEAAAGGKGTVFGIAPGGEAGAGEFVSNEGEALPAGETLRKAGEGAEEFAQVLPEDVFGSEDATLGIEPAGAAIGEPIAEAAALADGAGEATQAEQETADRADMSGEPVIPEAEEAQAETDTEPDVFDDSEAEIAAEAVAEESITEASLPEAVQPEAAMQAEPEKEPESIVVEEVAQADEVNPVEAGMEEVFAAEEPVAEAAALAGGSGEATQAEEDAPKATEAEQSTAEQTDDAQAQEAASGVHEALPVEAEAAQAEQTFTVEEDLAETLTEPVAGLTGQEPADSLHQVMQAEEAFPGEAGTIPAAGAASETAASVPDLPGMAQSTEEDFAADALAGEDAGIAEILPDGEAEQTALEESKAETDAEPDVFGGAEAEIAAEAVAEESITGVPLPDAVQPEGAMQAEPEKEPESVVVEAVAQAGKASPVEAGMEEVSAAEEPVAEAAALADGSGEATQAEAAAGDEADVSGELVMPEAENGDVVAVIEDTGEAEEVLLTKESEPDTVDTDVSDEPGALEQEESKAETAAASDGFDGAEAVAEESITEASLPEAVQPEAAMQAASEEAPERAVVEEVVQTSKVSHVDEADTEEVSAAEEPVAEAAALAGGAGEAQAEEAAGDEADVADEPVMAEAEDGGAVAVIEDTGETEEALLAGESEPKATEAEQSTAEQTDDAQAQEAASGVHEALPVEAEAVQAAQVFAVDEDIAETPTEEVAQVSSGAAVLPDPETALADGILLAEGEALPSAPVTVPDGVAPGPKGMIPEEDVFRHKMRSHQLNRMAVAEYKVAAAYAREGTPEAYREAARWYTRAAEKGHAVSRFNLGNIYYAGRGVAQDYARAADWYELAARQGVARAQDNLGLMFFHGRGRPVEPETAVYWFRQAAIQGFAPAQYKLAIHLEAGVGVETNREEALYWYRKAASQGHAQAEKEAARLETEAGQ